MQENFGARCDIVFNVKDGTLKNANTNVTTLNKQVNVATKNVSSLNATFENTFFALGSLNLAFSAIGASLGTVLKSSLNLASTNEQLKNSLASLISLNHSSTDAQGKAIDANTKWNASLALSLDTIKKLNVINLKTIYTMQDMSEMFKSFYSTAGSNMSLEEAISAMEAIAYAGQVSGASVDSLKMTLDSLGSGVAQTQTDFGRFISSLGLSTEAMSKAKAEGNLYSLIIEKLGSFAQDASKSANTYEASVSNLSNAYDELKKKAIEPYFEEIKNAINATSEAISRNQEAILQSIGVFSRLVASIALVWGASKSLNLALKVIAPLRAYALGLQGVTSCANGANLAINGLKTTLMRFAPTAGLFLVIEAWSRWNDYIKETQENLNKLSKDGLEKKLEDAQKRLESAKIKIADARSNGGIFSKFKEEEGISEYTQAYKEIQDLEHRIKMLPKEVKTQELIAKNKEIALDPKIIKDTSLAYAEMAKVGLSEYDLALLQIIEKTQKWIDSGVELGDALQTQNILMQDLETRQALKEMNAQLDIKAEEIAFLNEGLKKGIELEQIRYEKALLSLNARVAKEVEVGEMSLEFANRLYELEEKKHKQALKNIEEEYTLKSGFSEYFSSALSENFINVLDGGKLENFGKNLQKSASQALGRSLAKSFEDSKVGKAMDKAFDLAITKASGALGSCLDGIFGKDFASNLSQALGGALAGIGIGEAITNVLASFMPEDHAKGAQKGGSIGSSLGGLLGAGIGLAFGPAGAIVGGLIGGPSGGLLGSLIGGFYNKKVETTAEGVEVFGRGTKDYLNAKEYTDQKETKSYFWGLYKKKKTWTDYSDANAYVITQVRNTLRGFENLIVDIGGEVQELSIASGKYSSYDALADSVVSSVISSVMKGADSATISGVSKMWSDYAKSVDKSINEAVMEGMSSFVKSEQTYTKWLYDFRGDTLGSAKYTAELAQKEVDRLQEALGVSGINVDNFLAFREEAIKNAFDPNTINLINALGEALMKSAEASKKFEEALKQENKTKLKALDPFLKKTKTLEEANQTRGEIEAKTNLKILSTLQKILKAQEVVSYGGAI